MSEVSRPAKSLQRGCAGASWRKRIWGMMRRPSRHSLEEQPEGWMGLGRGGACVCTPVCHLTELLRNCCSPRAIHKQQPLCLLDRFSSVCVRHILVSVRCSLFDQHVSRRLPEHLPSVLQTPTNRILFRTLFLLQLARGSKDVFGGLNVILGRARRSLGRWGSPPRYTSPVNYC